MAVIRDSPFLANQVQVLELRHCISYDFDKRKLFNMFPNLRIIKLIGSLRDSEMFPITEPFEFTYSTSKVETLREYGRCELSRQLIASDRCSRLRRLTLKVNDIWRQNENSIRLLTNMLVLEKLALYHVDVKLDDFETLHKNVPSIKYLKIAQANLIRSNMPMSIQPATQLTRLKTFILGNASLALYESWYHYIGRKYTHLIDFDCTDHDLLHDGFDFTDQMYKRGLVPLFKQIGSSLKNLNLIQLPCDINIFETLDNAGCKLEIINADTFTEVAPIFQHIGQSKQAASIKDLVVPGMDIQSISLLDNFIALKKLEIRTNHHHVPVDIDLLELVKKCPNTLEELIIPRIGRKCCHSPTQINTCIKRLVLQDSNLSDSLESILATAFPNLTFLKLTCIIIHGFTIMLPNNHMSEVDISEHDIELINHSVTITTTKDEKTRYYTTGDLGLPYTHQVRSVPLEKLANDPMVRVVCASIKHFTFHNRDFVL
jgi:hypothetical protein